MEKAERFSHVFPLDYSRNAALRFENGEMGPFKDNMLVGNIFEIEAVGKESEDIGGFISPEVLIFEKLFRDNANFCPDFWIILKKLYIHSCRILERWAQ